MAPVESLPRPDFSRERKLRRAGFRRIAGVDEAGRGPLAGPVAAAAVILDPKAIPDGITDSKLLTAEEREAVFAALCETAEISVAFASVAAIERINIRAASLRAMRRALLGLAQPADAAIIDGRDVPPGPAIEMRAVIDGDALSLSVAAASIVAKVMRDRLMTHCDAAFAGYGLAAHKGYATPEHRSALAELGPCRLHRRTFASVAATLQMAMEL
jgi:ribonuclease HII